MVVDSNIVIAYLADDTEVIKLLTEWRQSGRPLFLSTVVEAEVLSFSGWSTAERYHAEAFLEENFTSIPFDRTVARLAAELRAKTKIKFPDAAIAATAIATRTPLMTRNIKDFKRIPDLQVVTI